MFDFNKFLNDFSIKLAVDLTIKLFSKSAFPRIAWYWGKQVIKVAFRQLIALLEKKITVSFQPFILLQKGIALSMIPLMCLLGTCMAFAGHGGIAQILTRASVGISGNVIYLVLKKSI